MNGEHRRGSTGFRWALGLALVVLAVAGAASRRGDQEAASPGTGAAPGTVVTAAGLPKSLEAWQAFGRARRPGADLARYGAGIERTLACLREHGARVNDPQLTPGGRLLKFSYGFAAANEEERQARQEAVNAVGRECTDLGKAPAEREWLAATAPTSEELRNLADEYLACMSKAKTVPSDGPHPAAVQCSVTFGDALTMNAPGS
jgi:hypothetical protein